MNVQAPLHATRVDYTIRELNLTQPDHVELLRGLWDAVYPGMFDPRFAWRYRHNPAGPARVWVAVASTGQVAGAGAVFPRILNVQGRCSLVGLPGDFLIAPNHRTLGPALMLQRRICAEAVSGWVEFLYGFPNLASEPVFRRLGYAVLAQRTRWVIPVRSKPLLRRLPGGRRWAPVAAAAIDLGLSLIGRIRARLTRVRVETSKTIDGEFDALWQRLRNRYPFSVERTGEYLRWRYVDSPLGPYMILKAVRPSGELVGYAVSRQTGETTDVCELIGENVDALQAMTAALWGIARRAGSERLELIAGKASADSTLRSRVGFTERPDPHHVIAYVPRSHLARAAVLEATNWLLVQSDGDT